METKMSGSNFESMDEFDPPQKLQSTFCEQVSVKQYEEQAIKHTEQHLQQLMDYLDKNPQVYKEVLKKRKKEELENDGFLSFLKVKMHDLLQKEDTRAQVTDAECQHRLEEMTLGMAKAFDYSQETKGRRTSKRLAEKRQLSKQKLPLTSEKQCDTRCLSPPHAPPIPPMAPPPPPVPSNNTKGKNSKPVARSKSLFHTPSRGTPLKDLNFQMNTPQSLVKPRKHERTGSLSSFGSFSTIGSFSSLHQELLSINPSNLLKTTATPRSPGGTPVKKKRTTDGSPSGVTQGYSPSEPLYKALLNGMHKKFKNVRSPSLNSGANSPTSGTASPGGFTP